MFRKNGAALLLSVCAICWTGMNPITPTHAQQFPNDPSDQELTQLLQRVQSNWRSNKVIAHQYVSDESTHTVAWNMKGKKLRDHTEKGESVFANGAWYYRIVERDGKPLSVEKQLSAQRHLDAVSELSKGFDFEFDLRDANPRDSVYSALPICCLTELFENRIVGYEQIDGHDTLVVESTPNANTNWGSPENRTALDWKETTWIDASDLMPVQIEVELINDKGFLLKGSTETEEIVKMQFANGVADQPKEKVWLIQTTTGRFDLKFLRSYQTELYEDRSYNFRRFTADVHVLADSAATLPNQASDSKQ